MCILDNMLDIMSFTSITKSTARIQLQLLLLVESLSSSSSFTIAKLLVTADTSCALNADYFVSLVSLHSG